MWCTWINLTSTYFLLSDNDNYGLLAKILFDLQVPTDSTYGKYNILAGTIPALAAGDFTGAKFTAFSLSETKPIQDTE